MIFKSLRMFRSMTKQYRSTQAQQLSKDLSYHQKSLRGTKSPRLMKLAFNQNSNFLSLRI